MAKFRFNIHQRFAIFTLHGERCYLCSRPLSLFEMEVDHVLPERLGGEPERLSEALRTYSLPTTFELNSYENWLPSCRRCNAVKSDTEFMPSPIVQVQLQQAISKAPRCRALEVQSVTRREVSKALALLARAANTGKSTFPPNAAIVVIRAAEPHRSPERHLHPLRLKQGKEVSHRIAHVDADQKFATCVDANGRAYRISLAGRVPDITDRQTQVGILKLIEEAIDVADVWDHYHDGMWVVSARRLAEGRVVELARHESRAEAVAFAFMSLPGGGPSVSQERQSPDGRVVEVRTRYQAERPYCFELSQESESIRFAPVGQLSLENAVLLRAAL